MPLYNPSSGSGASVTVLVVSGTTQAVQKNFNYVANNSSRVVFTLMTTAAVGDTFWVQGSGAGGWKLAQNAGQIVHFGASNTTTGTGGSLASTGTKDSIEVICTVANNEFNVIAHEGTITIV